MRVARRGAVALPLLGVLALAGCASGAAGASGPTEAPAPSAAAGVDRPREAHGSTEATLDPTPATTLALCAEFPDDGGALPGDVEAWWNATPANADGSVALDPEQWPAQMREHPRVATVEVDSGTVISLYDRTTCRQDPAGYEPPPAGPGWEPGGTWRSTPTPARC